MWLEQAIEVIKDHAGAHDAAAVLDVEFKQLIEILRIVDHQGFIDGLAAL